MSEIDMNTDKDTKTVFTETETNPAVTAMHTFQQEMSGEAQKAGLTSENEILQLVKSVRAGE